jgi:hypothetical protein
VSIKVSVRFREDEYGVKNLDIAYKTVARILLKRIKDTEQEKTGIEGGGGNYNGSLCPSKQ